MHRYETWIKAYEEKHDSVQYRCQGASKEMSQVFPELRLVRGYIIDGKGFSIPHWWCATAEGRIVDPTRSQFDDVTRYEEYSEELHGPMPIGKCLNCGDFAYQETNCNGFCREICEVEFRSYLEGL